MENGLRLTTISGLLAIITSLPLGHCRCLDNTTRGQMRNQSGDTAASSNLAGFVLGDFVLCVFLAVFALAVCAAGLRNVDLRSPMLAFGKPGHEIQERQLRGHLGSLDLLSLQRRP